MKRRVLSMILALCLIVGLLPAVAVQHAHAAVTTRTIQSMKGTDYEMTLTATSDGATVSYTKNQEITLEETDEEGNPLTEWVQIPADETDWNAKYYYDTEAGRFTLIMKGVKVTKNCTFAFGVNDKSISTQGGAMEFVITEDSYFENCMAIASRTAGSYRWSHTYVTSENGATLYVDNSGKSGAAAISVFNKLTVDANITAKTKTAACLYSQAVSGATTITINGGNLDLTALYAGSGKAYSGIESDADLFINGGNITIVSGAHALDPVPTIAEGLCYTLKDAKGEALAVDKAYDVGYLEFKSYPEHTAGAWAEGKTICAICGAAMECGHEFKEEVVKAPTCTAVGELLKTCTICGTTETVVMDMVPHSYVITDGEVVDGAFTRSYLCSVCGDAYEESVKVMSGTVTLFGTAVTVDTDSTTADIPEALYWVNGAKGELPVAATAADEWNYRFSIVNNIPTVTIRNAEYTGAASFLYAKFDGSFKLVYEGANNIKVPNITGKNASGNNNTSYFAYYASATNTAGKGHMYIEAAEDAVVNVTGGDTNCAMLTMGNRSYLTITGGTINMERTTAGGTAGVLSATYGKVAINNAEVNLKDLTAVTGKHPLVSIGNGKNYGLTITDSKVTMESNAYITLSMGVFQSNMKGVLYSAKVTINGDSDVKIINSSNNTGSTYAYNGVGIWALDVVVNGGKLEAEGLTQAIMFSSSTAVPETPESYMLYTEKGGAMVDEYTATTYFKAVPCDHADTEVVLEGSDYLTKCVRCGEVVNTVPCEHPETKVVIEGTDFVTYCTVCGAEAKREEAPVLATPYTMTIHGGEHKLTHYDIPIYLVQNDTTAYYWTTVKEEVAVTDPETGEPVLNEDGTPVTELKDVAKAVSGAYISQTKDGATEENYNAKLIWHSGDAAPTLYLRDFVIDAYNDELDKWRNNGSSKSNVYTTAGLFTDSTAPLKIVVDGNCVMQTYEGIHYRNELTIVGADADATLTMYTQRTGILPTKKGNGYSAADAELISGYKLTLDVNLDITQTSWANASYGKIIRTVGADLIINGGNIVTRYTGAAKSIKGIAVQNSGNLYINGGYVYSESYNSANMTEAAIEVAGDVYITGGVVEVKSASQSGIRATNFYISGGEIRSDVQYGTFVTDDENGVIVITGGTIESTSAAANFSAFMYIGKNAEGETTQLVKIPAVTAPEGMGLSILAGVNKDTAEQILDVSAYSYSSKYMKLEFVEVTCEHLNTTTNETIVTNATCTTAGSKKITVTCECGAIVSETTEEIKALGHTEEPIPGKDATCSATGLTEGKKCSVCGEILVEQEEIPAEEHDWIWVEGKEATCTEPGLSDTEICGNCGTLARPQEEIKALGHTPAEAVKENETATGYDLVVYCATCKTELSRETVTTGPVECTHTYTDDNDAVCNNCGYVRQMTDEYKFDNYRVVFADSNTEHKNARVELYTLGEQTVADPTDEKALRAIDANYGSYWGASHINKILITAAGNYVALLKYNVGTTTVKVPLVFSVDADPKLIIDQNNKLTVLDTTETHGHLRIFVYYLGDQTVEDIYDEAALQAIDPDAAKNENIIYHKMFIDRTALTKGGNYVVHLCWNIGTGPKITKAQQFTVFAIPTLTLDVNNMLWMSDENAENNSHRLTIYKMADDLDLDNYDIYDETQVKKDAINTSKTYWGAAEINGLEIYERGNYIIHLNYSVGTSAKRTIAIASFLNDRPVASVTDENKLSMTFTDPDITNARVYYYYFGENSTEGLDLYDKNALKNAAVSANTGGVWGTSAINKHTLKDLGKYVIHFEYNVKTYNEDGTAAGSAKKVVVVETTIYNPTKPVATLGEGNKLVVEHNNPDATNIRATIYNLGDETVEDIYNETALKAIDSAAKTKWGLTEINKTALEAGNNYVILVKYNVGTQTRTVAFQFSL